MYIALNVVKRCRELLKVVEGVKWVDGEEVVTEELKELEDEEEVPAIKHGDITAFGLQDIIEHIEDNFKHSFFFPEGDYRTTLSAYCETFVQSSLPWGFYPMLMYKDSVNQMKI